MNYHGESGASSKTGLTMKDCKSRCHNCLKSRIFHNLFRRRKEVSSVSIYDAFSTVSVSALLKIGSNCLEDLIDCTSLRTFLSPLFTSWITATALKRETLNEAFLRSVKVHFMCLRSPRNGLVVINVFCIAIFIHIYNWYFKYITGRLLDGISCFDTEAP